MGTEMTVTNWPTPAVNGAARSLLAEDLEIEGDVTSTGPVEVMGKITGTLRAPEVLVSTSGQVVGQITAAQLSVLGTVAGAVAARSVSLSRSARIQADITHETISIEAGAQFEGSLKRRV